MWIFGELIPSHAFVWSHLEAMSGFLDHFYIHLYSIPSTAMLSQVRNSERLFSGVVKSIDKDNVNLQETLLPFLKKFQGNATHLGVSRIIIDLAQKKEQSIITSYVKGYGYDTISKRVWSPVRCLARAWATWKRLLPGQQSYWGQIAGMCSRANSDYHLSRSGRRRWDR